MYVLEYENYLPIPTCNQCHSLVLAKDGLAQPKYVKALGITSIVHRWYLLPLLCPGVAIARGYRRHGMNWQTNTTAWTTPLYMW